MLVSLLEITSLFNIPREKVMPVSADQQLSREDEVQPDVFTDVQATEQLDEDQQEVEYKRALCDFKQKIQTIKCRSVDESATEHGEKWINDIEAWKSAGTRRTDKLIAVLRSLSELAQLKIQTIDLFKDEGLIQISEQVEPPSSPCESSTPMVKQSGVPLIRRRVRSLGDTPTPKVIAVTDPLPPLPQDVDPYQKAFDALAETQQNNKHSTVTPHIKLLMEQIGRLKENKKEPIGELIAALEDTNKLLTDRTFTFDNYKQTADRMQGHPSPALNAIGFTMIILGLALGAAIAAAGVGLVTAGIAGSAVALTSLGVFAFNKRAGLSLTMHDIANAEAAERKPAL